MCLIYQAVLPPESPPPGWSHEIVKYGLAIQKTGLQWKANHIPRKENPMRTVNRLNRIWNRTILWFHDASVRLEVRWMVTFSIWALDRLTWTLPEDWQLVDGITLREYKLIRELELARHQIRYYMDYAHELQWQILEQNPQKEEFEEIREEVPLGAC